MKCISPDTYKRKRLCLFCGKPISLECKGDRLPSSQQKYHFKCKLEIDENRRINRSLESSRSPTRYCVLCGKSNERVSLDHSNFCERCANRLKNWVDYNDRLKKSIDESYRVNHTRSSESKVRRGPSLHSKKSIKDYTGFNNKVLHRCSFDEEYRKKLNLPGKETCKIVHRDYVDQETGRLVHAEYRGSGFYVAR